MGIQMLFEILKDERTPAKKRHDNIKSVAMLVLVAGAVLGSMGYTGYKIVDSIVGGPAAPTETDAGCKNNIRMPMP